MAQYASTVDAQLELAISNLRINTSRRTALTGFLMQAIIMVLDFLLMTAHQLIMGMGSFSHRAEANPKTFAMHYKLSRLGQISVALSLLEISSTSSVRCNMDTLTSSTW